MPKPNTTHHSLNGDELRTIIEQRVKQGILQSLNLRAMYAYPLVRYKVIIEIVPYRPQGLADPVLDDKNIQRCVVDGQEFVAVVEDGVELAHDSPIIGWEKDPQAERDDTGLGRIETRRVEGQFVDQHVGAKTAIEEPDLPPPSGRKLAQGRVPDPEPRAGSGGQAAQVPVMRGPTVPVEPANTEGVPPTEAERIAKQEAEIWASPAPDSALQNALANEQPLPGRVTKLNK